MGVLIISGGYLPQSFGWHLASDLLICISFLADKVALSMDAAGYSPSLKGSLVPEKDDPCPVCFVDFDGRDVVPVIVITQCGHRYDLECIAKSFVSQPFGLRRCAMCRQDPIPLVNEDTGKFYFDEFFPDELFFYACHSGCLELFYLRLAQVGSVNGARADGFTPLMMAAGGGQFEIARVLIQAGANVNAGRSNAGDLNGWTALMSAAMNGRLEVARLLIEKGARVNDATVIGRTVLMVAAGNGALKVVELLIEKGAEVDGVSLSGATALISAVLTGQLEVVRFLIEKGARVDACLSNAGERNGCTALMLAAQDGRLDIARLLIENGASVNACRSNAGRFNGWTALMTAAHHGQSKMVELLLANGSDVGAKTANGETAQMLAANNNHWHIVEKLN